MNARAEANARLEGRFDARVLEPSPPAVNVAPWFADDPVGEGPENSGLRVVSPVATGDLRWEDLADGDTPLADWCAARWLAAHRPLPTPPPSLADTRRSLHRLAELVISPARQQANGKIGLRYTRGGFGTPFFGADRQIRVEGTELVVQDLAGERRARLESVSDAAAFSGLRDPPPEVRTDRSPLHIDPEATTVLGAWFGFAASVLEELRAETSGSSRVQLWPEHFDLSVELGSDSAGARASYGFSPGDEAHPEPYVYVAPWTAPREGPLWRASAFAGAELPYRTLIASDQQRLTALDFLRARRRDLTGA